MLPVQPTNMAATAPVAYFGSDAIQVITDALRSELVDAERLELNAALSMARRSRSAARQLPRASGTSTLS